ncbi:MAG: YncE family protein, partial [Planctomycetes bacterium]|nr:YncE family protein [Planctomycetota bacterium]
MHSQLASTRRTGLPAPRRSPVLVVLLSLPSLPGCRGPEPPGTTEPVGRADGGRVVLPVSQTLSPAGIQVELPGLRPQVLALSPDGRLLATSGKTQELVLLDPESGKVLQRAPLPSAKAEPAPGVVSSHILEPDKKGQASFTGLAFSPDGSRIFLSNVNGDIKVFAVEADRKVKPLFSLPLPPGGAPRRKEEIPSGLALSPDGTKLYVALNLSNRLGELDAATGKVLRLFDVGVAPYDVALAAGKAYVSNWGGRRPDAASVTGPAGQGTRVRVDPVRHIASEGSVTAVDLARGEVVAEVLVGLHASALAVAPGGRHVAVADAASDTVSVIDTSSDHVVETIRLRWRPGDLFGASPNALAFDETGGTLFVANGTQNAVALVSFRPGESQLRGLIPVGWFPGAIAYDLRRRSLSAANVKGVGSGKPRGPGGPVKHNSHEPVGSLSLVPVPGPRELEAHTRTVLEGYRRTVMEAAALPPRP